MNINGPIQKVIKSKDGSICISIAYQQTKITPKMIGKKDFNAISKKLKDGVWAKIETEVDEDSDGQMIWFAKKVELDTEFKIKER